MQPNNIALPGAEASKPRRNFFRGAPVFVPGIGKVISFAQWLAQGRRIAMDRGGLFEDLVDSAGIHPMQM